MLTEAMLKAFESRVAAAAAEAVRREACFSPAFRRAVGLLPLGPDTAWVLWVRARDREVREVLAARLVELAARGRIPDRIMRLVVAAPELRGPLAENLRPWVLPRIIRVGADDELVRAVAARTRDPGVLARAAEVAVQAGRDGLAQELARLAVSRELRRVHRR